MTQLKTIKEIRSRKKSIKVYIFCCNRTVVNELSICMLLRSQSIRNTCISLMSSYVNIETVWTFNWYVSGPRYELIATAVTIAAFVHSWNVKIRRNENIEKWPFLFYSFHLARLYAYAGHTLTGYRCIR